MLANLLATLASAITSVILAGGYGGVAALMAIESACIPLPSEIIMPFAGYLVSTGHFSLVGAATAGALGCNIGSTIVYTLAAHGGPALIRRWGRFVLLSSQELAWAERFFARHGAITVFIGRLLPVIRTFIALPAGIARMRQVTFQAYTFVGSWLWCYALAYVGAELGERWDSDPALRAVFHRLDAAILVALVALGAWFAWRHLRAAKAGRGRPGNRASG
ncbi:DedA family protein [Roseomonas hellenica]|uniref:DedA family protein n=1 Tax=Plastoroseomonas hellenica TaxID=2687306 RepID=A0ABS5ETR9_9PROT|nr:DedA family protein [Plastoroseomonas hellenica]MBR0663689.1 DedA family protein [Plastoroseomonas hellenica]